MELKKLIEKQILGKPLTEALRPAPTHKESLARFAEQALSKFPLRELGIGTEAGGITLSEENRQSHIHILGTTREGKSKFLEMLLSQDMGKYGATLLDPSDNGATAYAVLKWAMERGFEKVCLIDPHDAKFAVPTINPLRWKGAAACESVVQNVMESIRLLWGQTSFSDTPRIETYLKAVLAVLYMNQATIPDAACFLVKQDEQAIKQRARLFNGLAHYDVYRKTLEEVFNSTGQQLFLGEFKPSIRRLTPFFSYLPRMIYGSTERPLDFRKMISEGWIVLVNLDKTRLWGTAEQRILGTLIVNDIITAVSDLRHNGWEGKHYLYIDEAGQFATRVLADIMAYKGKSGLWATLSHQFYNQFEDKYVLDAVENLCHIKVLFFTPNAQDRARMIRDMYTGDLKLAAADAHAALKKQHAVIKIGKQAPVTFKVSDIDTPAKTKAEVEQWKQEKLYTNQWYRPQEAILQEITNRFDQTSNKATRPNAARPDNPVRQNRPSADAPASSPQDGVDNQTPTVQDAPVADERRTKGARKNVERKKGLSAGLVRQHKQNNEPLGE